MLKVVIADDEERVCMLVRMLVDWDLLGMEVVGTASNGLEALDLVESLAPSILITDIRMPGCDGLELIKRAKELSPHLEIILISGYAQFGYAQAAIRFEVGEYILKPIKKEILTAALEKLGAKCRERVATAAMAKQLCNKSSDFLLGRLIDDLQHARVGAVTREELLDRYGFLAERGSFQVFILKLDCPLEFFRSPSMDLVRQQAEEIFEPGISAYSESHVFQFRESFGYGVVCFLPENLGQIRRVMRESLNRLEAHTFGPVEFSLGAGKTVECPEELELSAGDAEVAVAQRLVEGSGRLLESGAGGPRPATRKLLEKYERALDLAVDTLNPGEAEQAADELYEQAGLLTAARGHAMLELALTAGKMLAMKPGIGEDAGAYKDFEERSLLCSSAAKLLGCLKSFIRERIEALRDSLESEAVRPIRIAKQYVARHFSEPITLDDVSAATGFSQSYFSTIFKKETGEGFSKYLTRTRIEQAKELLSDTGLTVSEICVRVGYSDIKHFNATFKKITSLNPGQYRKLYS